MLQSRGPRRSPGLTCGALADHLVSRGVREGSAHVGGLLVVVDVVDVAGQAKVCDLHHVVVGYQDITSSQIPVDTLRTHKHTHNL